MSIRQAIHQRLKNINGKELSEIINTSIDEANEETLVGLGVLFEDYYSSLDKDTKINLCNNLSKLLK